MSSRAINAQQSHLHMLRYLDCWVSFFLKDEAALMLFFFTFFFFSFFPFPHFCEEKSLSLKPVGEG